ncbi:MAG TPA: nucleoside triphosphate pyrophosphatase [Micromonosporaceae bacterium]
MSDRPTLVLASASPARLRTLQAAGIHPEVLVSGVDESIIEATNATRLCATLARLKAEAVATRLRQHRPGELDTTLVLGCDSVLEFGGEIFGKPSDGAEAGKRWQQMRGRSGVLHTGHCLVEVGTDRVVERVANTTVYFAEVSDEEITAYVSTGEPVHVAGAFTIDGLGGWFIERIDGDPGTVIGLSLPVLRAMLATLGLAVADLWTAPLASGR